MALPARDNRISRRSWLVAGLGLAVSRARAADSLAVSFDGDNLHIADPSLHFLTGTTLKRLKNADTVNFFSQLTLFGDNRGAVVLRLVRDRLVFSYDLWEEKFSATIMGASRTKSRLTAQQAEAWCIENLAISAFGIAPDRHFWLRFELRAASQKDLGSLVGDSGISLSSLMIDVFSRKPGSGDLPLIKSAGPLRLADLPRTISRGARNG